MLADVKNTNKVFENETVKALLTAQNYTKEFLFLIVLPHLAYMAAAMYYHLYVLVQPVEVVGETFFEGDYYVIILRCFIWLFSLCNFILELLSML